MGKEIKSFEDVQTHPEFKKRVVHLIKTYPQPRDIFQAITGTEHEYSLQYRPEYPTRDRAIMANYYVSLGRGAEVCGGPAYTRSLPQQIDQEGKRHCVVCKTILAGGQRKFCSSTCRGEIHTHRSPIVLDQEHQGILIQNVDINENRILISEMPVVKRSQTVIERYGPQATKRPPYAIPLKTGLYENQFWDQLVPFAWLIKEYYDLYIKGQKTSGKLYPIQNKAAYLITKEVTGNYLNWFRAQGKQFYGSFLFKRNAVELAEFVNDQDSDSERPYTRYDWTTQLKDKTMIMDFTWIQPAVDQIKERLGAD